MRRSDTHNSELTPPSVPNLKEILKAFSEGSLLCFCKTCESTAFSEAHLLIHKRTFYLIFLTCHEKLSYRSPRLSAEEEIIEKLHELSIYE